MAYCVFTNCLSILGSGITPYTSLDSRSGVSLTSNGQMMFVGSSDNSGPLGLVFQHINANGICRSDITSTRYGISGNDLSLNIDSTNPTTTGGMLIKYGGGVAIGTGQPCGALDVFKQGLGSTGTGDVLILRGGNNNNLYGTNQIRFGYSGGTGYSHAIKTRHNSGTCAQNAFDFFIWTNVDSVETVGTRNVMTLDGTGNVGIGTCSPTNLIHGYKSSGSATLALQVGGNYGYFFMNGCCMAIGSDSGATGIKLHINRQAPDDSLVINSSGNVGISTLSPSGYGHGGTNKIVEIFNCNTTSNAQSHIILSNAATSNPGSIGSITWAGTNYSSANRAGIISVATETTATTIPQSYMQFYTSDATSGILERMRINSCGNIGIGITSPIDKLEVAGAIHTSGTAAASKACTGYLDYYVGQVRLGITGANTTTPAVFRIDQYSSNASINRTPFYIDTCGSIGVNTSTPGTYKLNVNGAFYAAGSSKEYKTSICEYNTDSCMFMKLKPVTYDYKEEWKHLGKELKSNTQIGLIAEDTAEVFPELAVLKLENEEKVVRNVDYEKLTIVLLSEVQKLRKELDDLKTK